MSSPTASLLSECRACWRSSVKVVYKDLPRLAKRITIASMDGTIVTLGTTTEITATAAAHADTAAAAEATASASEEEKAEKKIDEVQEKSAGEDESAADKESSIPSADSVSDSPAAASSSDPPAAAEASAPAAVPVPVTSESSICAHSSSRRPSLPSAMVSDFLSPSSFSSLSPWPAVRAVLSALASQLENADMCATLHNRLLHYDPLITEASDYETTLNELICATVGVSSLTFKILQCIHQSILFPVIFHLKTRVFASSGELKDVRRPDGWRVNIYIGDAISVTHIRWEQSLHEENNPLKFEVQWEARYTFDRNMEDMRAVMVKILDIKFHEHATADRKAQIMELLKGNGYIV